MNEVSQSQRELLLSSCLREGGVRVLRMRKGIEMWRRSWGDTRKGTLYTRRRIKRQRKGGVPFAFRM